MTTPTSSANLTQLLSDLDSATSAVASGDWVSAGLDGATSLLDVLGSDPLSGIVNAGFGWVTQFVSFLAAPSRTLQGDSGVTSTSAQGSQSAGQSVGSLADAYQQAAGTQTSGWSGTAASGYQNTTADLANELRAIAKSTSGVSTAVTGAGKVVGQAQQVVGQLVTEASGKINAIMTQAMATAQITGGASIAAAIPQVVQVATQYGEQIAQKMGALLSSAQNLAALVLVVLRCLEVANTALSQTTSSSTTSTGQTSTGQTSTSQTSTGQTAVVS